MNKTTALKLLLLFAAIMLVSASIGAAMPPSGGHQQTGQYGHHHPGANYGHHSQPVWHGWGGYWGQWWPWGYYWR